MSIRATRSPVANDDIGMVVGVLPEEQPALNLVTRLCQALREEEVRYCHWKSNNALDRSASGDNDLDFLVSRADIPKFTGILSRLDFKQALADPGKRMPGVLDYFGLDEESGRLVHVHAHYQLVLGHDMTKNFRIPIEQPYLESAVRSGLFKVPAPEFEFLIFAIRMVLKHATWDAILFGEGRLKSSEREEFKYLQARVDPDRVREILVKNLPYLDLKLFEHCLQVLRPGCPLVKRIQTGHRLQICLGPFARRPLAADTLLKIGRRAAIVIRRRIFKSKSKYRLAGGGAMIAILGGDGSGKSTAVKGLRDWLSKDFDTAKGHMGKPPWSLTTYLIRGILKVGSLSGLTPPPLAFGEMQKRKTPIPPEYPWLLREICTARDRYRAYRKARAFSNDGGIVFLDRFPHIQTRRMDGPRGRLLLSQQSGPLIRRLIWLEERYYRPIVPPELVIVLRVDPEIAVQRKADENPAFVRERAMEIWQVNWENTGVHVIDAGKSKAEVLAELKALVWAHL